MAPGEVFSFTVFATAVALAVQHVAARRTRRALRRLAGEWGMTYSPGDPLRLTPKVAARFPVPGAANLRVTDVIYGSEHDRYRYVFRTEFTTGTVSAKRRQTRVGTFSEPRDRQQRTRAAAPVDLAPAKGTLLDQYRNLAPATAARRARMPSERSGDLAASETHDARRKTEAPT